MNIPEPSENPAWIMPDGVIRVMGCLPPLADYGGLPKFAAANRVIPRSEWRDIDLSPLGVPVLNQGQHGSCVGHGSTTAYWFAYLIAGGTVPIGGFSPTSLYAQINGNRDRGAVVSDAMTAMMTTGIGLMSDVPESLIYDRQISAEAKAKYSRFRVLDAYHCSTFDEIGSALQLGFTVSYGITLAANFNNLDSEGVAGHGWGVLGGHCMAGFGTKKLNSGKWAIRNRNSWGQWGQNGNCFLVEEHFGRDCDAFAIRAAMFDPMDPQKLPVAL